MINGAVPAVAAHISPLAILAALGGVVAFLGGIWALLRGIFRQISATEENTRALEKLGELVNDNTKRIAQLERQGRRR